MSHYFTAHLAVPYPGGYAPSGDPVLIVAHAPFDRSVLLDGPANGGLWLGYQAQTASATEGFPALQGSPATPVAIPLPAGHELWCSWSASSPSPSTADIHVLVGHPFH